MSIQGGTILLTGLSGAGKSTLSIALAEQLGQQGRRSTLLDGDEVRRLLSSELGFSRQHRELNVLRNGFVAREVAKHGGVTICALIAPYQSSRDALRELAEQGGVYVEVYVSTSLEECERRDPKGNYRRARAGQIKGFTGLDDPFEAPSNPDLILDTTSKSVAACVTQICTVLKAKAII